MTIQRLFVVATILTLLVVFVPVSDVAAQSSQVKRQIAKVQQDQQNGGQRAVSGAKPQAIVANGGQRIVSGRVFDAKYNFGVDSLGYYRTELQLRRYDLVNRFWYTVALSACDENRTGNGCVGVDGNFNFRYETEEDWYHPKTLASDAIYAVTVGARGYHVAVGMSFPVYLDWLGGSPTIQLAMRRYEVGVWPDSWFIQGTKDGVQLQIYYNNNSSYVVPTTLRVRLTAETWSEREIELATHYTWLEIPAGEFGSTTVTIYDGGQFARLNPGAEICVEVELLPVYGEPGTRLGHNKSCSPKK